MNRLIVNMRSSMDGFVGSNIAGSTWQRAGGAFSVMTSSTNCTCFINPAIAGDGPRIFDGTMTGDRYELIDVSPSECGILPARRRRRDRLPAEGA